MDTVSLSHHFAGGLVLVDLVRARALPVGGDRVVHARRRQVRLDHDRVARLHRFEARQHATLFLQTSPDGARAESALDWRCAVRRFDGGQAEGHIYAKWLVAV